MTSEPRSKKRRPPRSHRPDSGVLRAVLSARMLRCRRTPFCDPGLSIGLQPQSRRPSLMPRFTVTGTAGFIGSHLVDSAPPSSVINLGGGHRVTLLGALEPVAEVTGLSPHLVHHALKADDTREAWADPHHARRHLDRAPRGGLAEGLAAEWVWITDAVADGHATAGLWPPSRRGSASCAPPAHPFAPRIPETDCPPFAASSAGWTSPSQHVGRAPEPRKSPLTATARCASV